MQDFPRHTVDLAYAIRTGDIAGAEIALDMMVRDSERPTNEMIQMGRVRADHALGKVKPLPRLASPDPVTIADRQAA